MAEKPLDTAENRTAPNARPPQMTELQGSGAPGNGAAMNLDFLLDIPLNLTVEVGRTRMLIGDLLQLGQGTVVELNKPVGEPFDIMVNNKLIARGEVVVINDRLGVRLTDIVSATERVESLA